MKLIKEDDNKVVLSKQDRIDLVVNAIYFNNNYLTDKLKEIYPTKDSIIENKDDIIKKLMSDKQIDKDTAKEIFDNFVDLNFV